MGIDDFEVTFTGTGSDDGAESAVNDQSRQQQPHDDPAAVNNDSDDIDISDDFLDEIDCFKHNSAQCPL
jgi:hypothetical protein